MEFSRALGRIRKFETFLHIIKRAGIVFGILYLLMGAHIFIKGYWGLEEIDQWRSVAVVYIQTSVSLFFLAAVFYQAAHIFTDSIEQENLFLPSHTKRLRTMAMLLVITALLAFASSAAVYVIATGNFPFPGVTFGDWGFSSLDDWALALGENKPLEWTDENGVVYSRTTMHGPSLDLAVIAIASMIWGFSYLFDYGAVLQDDADHTL